MSYSCPLNYEQVDSNASRLSSLMVAALVITYLLSSIEYILYFLVIDFCIRLFVNKRYSPISALAHKLRKILGMKESFIDGGAKRLAGMFGLTFVVLLVILDFYTLPTLSYIVAAIFLSCSLLDVFINYCLGCQIYFLIKKIYPSFMS